MFKMTMNVLVGLTVMLMVFGPAKSVEIYLNTHAVVVKALINLG